MRVREAIKRVESSKAYQEWAGRDKCFLVHAFNSKNDEMNFWQIGYYNPDTEVVTVFQAGDDIEIIAEDEILKRGNGPKELDREKIDVSFENALEVAEEESLEKYPNIELNKSIGILQMIKNHPVWNLTFVTNSLDVLNCQVSAEDKSVRDITLKPLFRFDR